MDEKNDAYVGWRTSFERNWGRPTKRPPLGKERRPQGRDGARSSTDEVPSSLLSEPLDSVRGNICRFVRFDLVIRRERGVPCSKRSEQTDKVRPSLRRAAIALRLQNIFAATVDCAHRASVSKLSVIYALLVGEPEPDLPPRSGRWLPMVAQAQR